MPRSAVSDQGPGGGNPTGHWSGGLGVEDGVLPPRRESLLTFPQVHRSRPSPFAPVCAACLPFPAPARAARGASVHTVSLTYGTRVVPLWPGAHGGPATLPPRPSLRTLTPCSPGSGAALSDTRKQCILLKLRDSRRTHAGGRTRVRRRPNVHSGASAAEQTMWAWGGHRLEPGAFGRETAGLGRQ